MGEVIDPRSRAGQRWDHQYEPHSGPLGEAATALRAGNHTCALAAVLLLLDLSELVAASMTVIRSDSSN